METDSAFAGSIPAIYDSHLVPLIFEDFAADLAHRVAVAEPASVLETAAGSGVLTRALAPLLGPQAGFVVTDLNAPMLARARERQPADDRLAWQACDALRLPFADAAFDAVCCQFGAMFFPDRVAAHAEARRVLRPGGSYWFSVWDRIGENAFADVVTRAAAEAFPDDPPLFLARTPHGYHDLGAVTADLRAAGFSDVSAQTLTMTSTAETAEGPAIAYCQGTPLRTEIEARDPSGLDRVTGHAAAAIRDRFGPGPVSGPIRGHVICARG